MQLSTTEKLVFVASFMTMLNWGARVTHIALDSILKTL